MVRVPILIRKIPFSNIKDIGTMESKKRQLDKHLRFYSEMELNTQVTFQMEK